MSRFKFRSWNSFVNKYSYFSEPSLLANSKDDTGLLFKVDNCNLYIAGYGSLEQSTGIRDKNKKLIYDNDIVKKGNYLYKVVWNNITAGFMLVPLSCNNNIKSANISSECEIIGNIHENKELLEEVK